MMRPAILLIVAALSGCAVSVHGNQTSSGGSTATSTGSSVRGSTTIGNARIGGSFGPPPAVNAPGGQATFSQGAAAVVVLGLVIAGAVEVVGDWFKPAAEPREPLSPGGISHTCSCYGWQPELTPAPPPQ